MQPSASNGMPRPFQLLSCLAVVLAVCTPCQARVDVIQTVENPHMQVSAAASGALPEDLNCRSLLGDWRRGQLHMLRRGCISRIPINIVCRVMVRRVRAARAHPSVLAAVRSRACWMPP